MEYRQTLVYGVIRIAKKEKKGNVLTRIRDKFIKIRDRFNRNRDKQIRKALSITDYRAPKDTLKERKKDKERKRLFFSRLFLRKTKRKGIVKGKPKKEDKEMEQQAYQLIAVAILLVIVAMALTLGRK